MVLKSDNWAGSSESRIPDRLFKYCPPERVDVLQNERIRFTPPAEFNDPFELLPRLPEATPEYVAKWLLPAKERAFAFTPPEKCSSWTEFNKRLGDKGRPDTDAARQGFQQVQKRFSESFQRNLSQVLGILSLAEAWNNLLMWAHYGARHTGLVYELQTSDGFFEPLSDLLRVEYRAERPLYAPEENQHDEESIIPTLKTKSAEWEHEKEWRLLRYLKDLMPYDKDGKTLHLAVLPASAIRAVYLGARCDVATRALIETEIKRPGRDHIKLFKLQLNQERFELDRVSI